MLMSNCPKPVGLITKQSASMGDVMLPCKRRCKAAAMPSFSSPYFT